MAKAKKLPSGNWRVNLYVGTDDNGKRIYKSFTASTKKEAEFLAAEYNLKRKEKPKDVTVGDAIDGYIASKENVLSPTTISGYRKIRRNDMQQIMDVPLNKLTSMMVQSEVNREALRLSPKTLRNVHGLVAAAITMYMPDFVLRTTLPAKQHKIKTLPNPEDVMRAVSGTEVELPVLLALWLGMRLSEIQGLRFSDIQDGILSITHVRVAVNKKYIEKDTTKTYNSTRRLRVPQEIMDKIEAIPHKSQDDYVCNFARGGIYSRFRRCIRNAGLSDMSFHDLRHMNASIMVALGIPDKYAMERGGWSSSGTLQNIYQHTFADERQNVDDRIDAFFRDLDYGEDKECNTKCNIK